MSNTAIILGAGSGTRMKSEKSKLLLEFDGMTVLERSVRAFMECGAVEQIVIAVREQDRAAFEKLVGGECVTFVTGGATRQESVKNAVAAAGDTEYILIHDGARPLIQKADILKALEAAQQCGAAAVGVPVKDTLKVLDSEQYVADTPDRSKLFAVQTPQVFRLSLYRDALAKAESDGRDFTDDCQLAEYIGAKVKMVQGSYSNIKITTPDDIALAQYYLNAKQNGGENQ